MIVNGRGRGFSATLLRIHEDKFNCDVRVGTDILGGAATALISAGSETGSLFGLFADRELTGIEYEDISKLATE